MDAAATTLLGMLAPRMVDEDPPHHLRGDGEKMPTILPIDLALTEQLDVRLTHHCRRLHAVLAPFARQLP
jgi:hypothetical protein